MVRTLRWGLVVCAAGVVACSHDHGAVLELHSLPAGTRSIVVILAGVAEDSNDPYDGERLTVMGQAGEDAQAPVDYFKQVDSFELDGADTSLGIYNAEGTTVAQYIPFVLAFDTAGGSGNRLAAGTFAHAASVTIRDSEQDVYDVNMEPVMVAPVPVGGAIAEGNFIPVPCLGTVFDSGFAWHTMSAGSQVRVLTPLDPDPIGKTAHDRGFDLDCDGNLVAGGGDAHGSGGSGGSGGSDVPMPRTDCDDLEPTVYADALNTTCAAPNSCSTTGLAACMGTGTATLQCSGSSDSPPMSIGSCLGTAQAAGPDCVVNPYCACLAGSGGARCSGCELEVAGTEACLPATASIMVQPCTACTFTLAAISPPSWRATVTATGANTFTLAVDSPVTTVHPLAASVAQVYVNVNGMAGGTVLTNIVLAVDLAPTPATKAGACSQNMMSCSTIIDLSTP